MKVEINDYPRQVVICGMNINLQRFLQLSSCAWEGKIDGKRACLWGLIVPTLLSDQAYLWLDTEEVAEQHQFLLVRYSARMIERMLQDFSVLQGHCLTNNLRAQRWLKWLGAEFDFPDGQLIPFTIRRK